MSLKLPVGWLDNLKKKWEIYVQNYQLDGWMDGQEIFNMCLEILVGWLDDPQKMDYMCLK